jgi:hypothetical protein
MFNRKNQKSSSKGFPDESAISADNKGRRHWLYIAGIILLILLLYVGGKYSRNAIENKNIQAVDLRVNNQIDLISGENIIVNPVAGRMFIPVDGEGTYLLDMNLTTAAALPINLISEKSFSFYALSHDGTKLAGVNKQGIYILDMSNRQISTLIEGNNESLFYEDPYWAPDNKTLYISKRNELLSPEILQISVESKEMKKITDGSYPSISSDHFLLIFVREGHIFKCDLKSGHEEDLGTGNYPALSPDRKYIACIKENNTPNSEYIRDVYVISLNNPKDIKKITNNFPNKSIQVEDSLNLLSNTGYYDYYNPAWGSDSRTLYVSRAEYSQKPEMTIRKIMLSGILNTAKEMMNSWLEARMNQDTEMLRYLTDNLETMTSKIIPEINPQAVAIKDTGWQGKGLYVEVQTTFTDPVKPSYQLLKEHINVENELESYGYRIKQLQIRQSIQYYGKKDGIYKLEKGQEEKLLDLEGESLSLLSFNQVEDKLIYCIKEKGTYQIKSYNILSKKTETMDSSIPVEASLEAIGYSYSGQLMSVQFNYQSKKTIYVYNLKLQKIVPVPFLQDIKRAYWLGNNMKVDSGNDIFTLHWIYDPGLGKRFL